MTLLEEIQKYRMVVNELADRSAHNSGRWDYLLTPVDYTSPFKININASTGFEGSVFNAVDASIIRSAIKETLDSVVTFCKSIGIKLTWTQVHGAALEQTQSRSRTSLVWKYWIEGTDNKGNIWGFYKYEGNVQGGGQTRVYLNGAKIRAVTFKDALAPTKPWNNAKQYRKELVDFIKKNSK